MEVKFEWEKRSEAEIVTENRRSTLNFDSIMAWVVPILGIILTIIGNNFMYLIVGGGFGCVISA